MSNHKTLRSRISQTLRDTTAILIQLRNLVAEIVFTVAAFYGLVHAMSILTR